MTDFVRGMQDRIKGYPAKAGESEDYESGYGYQYEKEAKQEALCRSMKN